jgi:hypothetical protein
VETTTSGVAASIITSGRIAHSHFKVHSPSMMGLLQHHEIEWYYQLLRTASLIIWEEVTKR